MTNPVERTSDQTRGNKSPTSMGGLIAFVMMDFLGFILFAVGWFSKNLSAEGAIHPLLNDSNIQLGLMVLGGVFMVLGGALFLRGIVNNAKLKRGE